MKNTLRQEILQKRKEMSEGDRQRESQKIITILCGSKRYQKADTIFTFVSMNEEINTYPLIEQAWQDGKKVAVPIAKIRGRMYFVEIASFSELKKSRFGVLEPQKGEEAEVIPSKTDFFLVPGSVFDQKGNRYGYGGGYYDRYFERHPAIYKIGAAFSFQVMEFILQVEANDIPVDCIVTEKGLLGGSDYEYFD
ncbi:MAG: 5-formyltetrahydrofolate cyclo-ligase [Anaerotignum sp.]|nr:5-formyltetrahydrofolate cyclo-ligase [Anaerotignum sp.]